MLLEIKERFTLLGLLPSEGNLLTMKLVQGLRNALEFDEAEQLACSMKMDGTQITWDPKTLPQEVAIGELGHSVIADAFRDLDSTNKLTIEHLPLYEKFVTAKPQEE